MLWALKHHLGPWAYEEHCIAFVSDVRKKLFHLVNQQCQVAHSYFILLFEVVSRWKFFFRLSVTPMQVLRSEQYSSAQISTEWLSTATVVSDDVFRLCLQTMTSDDDFRLCLQTMWCWLVWFLPWGSKLPRWAGGVLKTEEQPSRDCGLSSLQYPSSTLLPLRSGVPLAGVPHSTEHGLSTATVLR